MGRQQRVGDHGDPGADPAQHRQDAHGLAAAPRGCLLDDEGGRHAAHQGLEAHGDQADYG